MNHQSLFVLRAGTKAKHTNEGACGVAVVRDPKSLNDTKATKRKAHRRKSKIRGKHEAVFFHKRGTFLELKTTSCVHLKHK